MLKNTLVRVSEYDIKSTLKQSNESLKLSDWQIEQLATKLDMAYIIKTYEEIEVKNSFLIRLTLPLYFLIVMFSWFIICPIKWLLTGRFYVDVHKSKVGRFMNKWYEKL